MSHDNPAKESEFPNAGSRPADTHGEGRKPTEDELGYAKDIVAADGFYTGAAVLVAKSLIAAAADIDRLEGALLEITEQRPSTAPTVRVESTDDVLYAFLVSASGEGSTDYRILHTWAELRAFYAEAVCGEDSPRTKDEIDAIVDAFRDPTQWVRDVLHIDLYCASFDAVRFPRAVAGLFSVPSAIEPSEAERVLRSIRPTVLHEAQGQACPTCDPGNEGAEIWGNVLDDIDRVIEQAAMDGTAKETP